MSPLDQLLSLLTSRSFGTLWYWILLGVGWTIASRNVLGIPPDEVARARREAKQGTGDLRLLDWLSLVLPRWEVGPVGGAVLFGFVTFGIVVLFLLGFRYGRETAQASFLLLGPLSIVFLLRIRLANRLRVLLVEAESDAIPAAKAQEEAVRRIGFHRTVVMIIAMLSILIATFWGLLWIAMHPFGR